HGYRYRIKRHHPNPPVKALKLMRVHCLLRNGGGRVRQESAHLARANYSHYVLGIQIRPERQHIANRPALRCGGSYHCKRIAKFLPFISPRQFAKSLSGINSGTKLIRDLREQKKPFAVAALSRSVDL